MAQKKYEEGVIVKKGNSLYQKYYKSVASETRRTATTWWDDAGLISSATGKLKQLMGEETFDSPKPVELIDRMLRMITFNDKDAIVLDFFAGSSTTAHATMAYNAETNGNRKFILVQLPELVNEKSEAYSNGYRIITEIGKKRIIKAGEILLNEHSITSAKLDIGFRVLKCDSSNMKDVYYSPNEYKTEIFDSLADNIKEDRTPEDLLFQVMLDLGIMLSSKIQREVLKVNSGAEYTYFNVADGFLIACFDNNISDEVITEIAKKKPYYTVLRDSSMANDSVATNFEQILATYNPGKEWRVL